MDDDRDARSHIQEGAVRDESVEEPANNSRLVSEVESWFGYLFLLTSPQQHSGRPPPAGAARAWPGCGAGRRRVSA